MTRIRVSEDNGHPDLLGAERMATILTSRGCRDECAITWRYSHGSAWDTRPGTNGYPGDVRRCEHGRLWIFERHFTNTYYCEMDRWQPISRWWRPLLYRKASRALAVMDQQSKA